jgi:hypothetical protein
MSKASRAGFSAVKACRLKGKTKATPEEREKARKQKALVEKSVGKRSGRSERSFFK